MLGKNWGIEMLPQFKQFFRIGVSLIYEFKCFFFTTNFFNEMAAHERANKKFYTGIKRGL